MKAKRFLALILALVMALSLVACGDSGKTPAADGDSNGGGDSSFPKMTWTAATSGAEGSNFDVGLEKFSELLQEKTNGAVKLDIYCSDQLTNGSTADSVQACMDGTIDVTFQADGIWGNFDTVFNIPNLPFLFDSYDDVDSKLINGEGGKYLMKAMEDKYNVKCLGIGENGFRYLTNRKHPVKTPDDLHDLKLRISVCLDPVMNQAAKLHYMTGGQVKIPMVIRAPMGTGRRGAAQHSQNMEALFAHIPGLKLVCPSTPADAKGLLMTAIRDDDPVVFLEHKLLYPQKVEMPDDVAPIPLGSANIRREGTDLTILTWARQVNFSLEAAEKLAADGVSAEVIDLRSLVPLDWDTIRDSVSKTHRVLIAEEDVKRCGFGAELSAQIMEELFDQLDAPVRRVAALNSSVPFCAELEDEIYPNPERIAAEAAALLKE